MSPARPGRRPGDRRVPVRSARPRRYFRAVGPGVVVARPAAIEPANGIALGGHPPAADRSSDGRWRTPRKPSERLSKVKALAVFASDNLSSVAYATEAILFTLLAAGTAAFGLAMPISVLIVTVLGIIVISYRQTIRAYPNGGGELHRRPREPRTRARPRRGGRAPDRLRADGVGQRRGRESRRSPRPSRARSTRARARSRRSRSSW